MKFHRLNKNLIKLLCYFIVIYFVKFTYYVNSEEIWEQDSTASITESKIKTINNEVYSNILLTGTWTDNLGFYGTYKCNASSYKRIEKVILDGICEGVNQNNEKYWYKINRNSSTMDAGVGKQTYLEGTGRYKVLKGISCNYGVRYLNNINYVKTKCVINEDIKGLLEK
ncbi:hypothetical protein OA264_03430 [Alphaproteobacteria bacterium]|nr:hypothetical protein [Alphaproteobacteria bacterium]